MKKSLLFRLFLLFLFFLPLQSLMIGSVFVGTTIGFDRFFMGSIALVIFCSTCINPRFALQIFKKDTYDNPYVWILLFYFFFSVFYYYSNLLIFENVAQYGAKDFFLRGYQARPLAQILSFVLLGIIPFVLMRWFSQDDKKRTVIEKTFVSVILFLVYYGFFQQVCYLLGLPVTGRDIYEGRVAYFIFQGFSFLRFYSLGGEPRNFSAFIIGALLFYGYYYYGRMTRGTKINLFLILMAFLLSFSSTGHLVFLISLGIILCDALLCKRVQLRKRHVKYLVVFLVVAGVAFQQGIFTTLFGRSVNYVDLYGSNFGKIGGAAHGGYVTQSVDVGAMYYLLNIPNLAPTQLFFGVGYGNFLTPMLDILKTYFNYDIITDGSYDDTRVYLFKLFVECGLVGVLIYLLMFFYALRLSQKLISFYQKNNQVEYIKMLLLRYAFIVFFVSYMVQISSFYYLIIMGLIIGKLNALANKLSR